MYSIQRRKQWRRAGCWIGSRFCGHKRLGTSYKLIIINNYNDNTYNLNESINEQQDDWSFFQGHYIHDNRTKLIIMEMMTMIQVKILKITMVSMLFLTVILKRKILLLSTRPSFTCCRSTATRKRNKNSKV